ncbi:Sec-independent protein translocase protein TatB [Marinobacter oulmenensis]|uniref:Sec-independent protein translocase protein TatB n=1 Tax=Marinobacter oulmenensis TaxID=643747 RepID=A0A840U9N2_9GAMM|nr:Sec-independent protein translocase protein TatB [Marinobacter oulmenensis]MBB5319850.1 sec-independent protein translocase protein TatB [Marinobacter oulmenensis]
MFDIGFLELLICGVIALLVLGPERLPAAARAAGRWVGGARRMVGQFTSELDRQLKAEELREELRKAGDVGLDDVQQTVRGALDEAKKYEHMIVSDKDSRSPARAPDNDSPAPDSNDQQDRDTDSGTAPATPPESSSDPRS